MRRVLVGGHSFKKAFFLDAVKSGMLIRSVRLDGHYLALSPLTGLWTVEYLFRTCQEAESIESI